MAHPTLRGGETGAKIVDALGETIERVRTLYSEGRSTLSLSRFDIGVEVRKVMDDETRYGKHAVRRLAEGVGRTEDDLYRYALLPDAWTRKAFAGLCTRPTKQGVPLSLSHFILIAKQPKAVRERIVQFALSHGGSVRALAAEVRRLTADDGEPTPKPRAPHAVFRSGVRTLGKKLDELEAIARELPDGSDLLEGIEKIRTVQRVFEERIGRARARKSSSN